MQYQVSISLDEAAARNQGPDLSEGAIVAAVQAGLYVWLARVVATAGELAPKDLGVLAGSLEFDVTGTTLDDLEGVAGTPVTYGMVVEFGRSPGKPPPPPGSLLGWMDRHGMEVSLEAEEPLRWAIAVKGTVPQPFLIPAFEEHLDSISETIASRLFTDAEAGKGAVRATGQFLEGGA